MIDIIKSILFYDLGELIPKKQKPWWMTRKALRLRIQEYNKRCNRI